MSKRIVDEDDLTALRINSFATTVLSAVILIILIVLAFGHPRVFFPGWGPGFFNFTFLFVGSFIIFFMAITICFGILEQFKKYPIELTTDEKIKEHEEQIALTNKEIRRTEKEDELVQRQMELAEKKQRLSMLIEGKTPDEKDSGVFDDFKKRVENIDNFDEIKALAEEEKKKRPHLAEYFDAIMDVYREKLLRDE